MHAQATRLRPDRLRVTCGQGAGKTQARDDGAEGQLDSRTLTALVEGDASCQHVHRSDGGGGHRGPGGVAQQGDDSRHAGHAQASRRPGEQGGRDVAVVKATGRFARDIKAAAAAAA
jgi:hypothetical protein